MGYSEDWHLDKKEVALFKKDPSKFTKNYIEYFKSTFHRGSPKSFESLSHFINTFLNLINGDASKINLLSDVISEIQTKGNKGLVKFESANGILKDGILFFYENHPNKFNIDDWINITTKNSLFEDIDILRSFMNIFPNDKNILFKIISFYSDDYNFKFDPENDKQLVGNSFFEALKDSNSFYNTNICFNVYLLVFDLEMKTRKDLRNQEDIPDTKINKFNSPRKIKQFQAQVKDNKLANKFLKKYVDFKNQLFHEFENNKIDLTTQFNCNEKQNKLALFELMEKGFVNIEENRDKDIKSNNQEDILNIIKSKESITNKLDLLSAALIQMSFDPKKSIIFNDETAEYMDNNAQFFQLMFVNGFNFYFKEDLLNYNLRPFSNLEDIRNEESKIKNNTTLKFLI